MQLKLPAPSVIIGGQEAWQVADLIASKNVSVILNPARCTPSTWFTQRCKVSGVKPSSLEILQSAGINVGLSFPEDNFFRGLIWEAGWAIKDLTSSDQFSDFEFAKKAIALVTWNVAKAFGIEHRGLIQVGQPPNFVVYNGVPGTLKAKVSMVIDGELVETNTAQY